MMTVYWIFLIPGILATIFYYKGELLQILLLSFYLVITGFCLMGLGLICNACASVCFVFWLPTFIVCFGIVLFNMFYLSDHEFLRILGIWGTLIFFLFAFC